jgi:hypothetical protein
VLLRNLKEAFETNMVKTEQIAGRRTTGFVCPLNRASMRHGRQPNYLPA